MRFTGKCFILCYGELVGQDLRPLVAFHGKYCLGNVSTVFLNIFLILPLQQ